MIHPPVMQSTGSARAARNYNSLDAQGRLPCVLLGDVVPSGLGPAGSPEDVGAGGRTLVDVLRQPPLHRHVPVPHALPHPRAEVCAVAVDVADGLVVVLQGSRLLRAGGWRVGVGYRHATQPGPLPMRVIVPAPCFGGGGGQVKPLAVTVAGATGEGSPGSLFGEDVGGGATGSPGNGALRKSLEGLWLLGHESLAT